MSDGLKRAPLRTALALAAAALAGGLLLARSACAPAHPGGASAAATTTPSSSPATPAQGSAAQQRAPELASLRAAASGREADVLAASTAPTDAQRRALGAAFRAARDAAPAADLLGDIERTLRRAPPREVHALLAARRAGAGHDALLRQMQRDLPSDYALRALVVRWINEVDPDPQAPQPARTPTLGSGRNRWIKPFEKR